MVKLVEMSDQSSNHENDDYEEDTSYFEDSLGIQHRCRLCLKESPLLIPVQENLEGVISTVALKIDILTTVKVAPSDKICPGCRSKVRAFYAFRVMCLRSDARIRGSALKGNNAIGDIEPLEPIRSYKRQRRDCDESFNLQNNSGNDALSITPVSHNANGNSMGIDSRLGSGLTISAVPMMREADSNENGYSWDRDVGNGNNQSMNTESGNGDDSQEEETENLEVSVDPFMLMGDETEQPNYAPVSVRGQILYPVIGNNTHIPSLQPGPHRPGPLPVQSPKDRDLANKLLEQMSTPRPKATSSGLDGSFLDKPFKCDVCPESFSYYKSFLKHKQRHTGELQPLKCEFCPDQFQTSRQLQNHLKYHNVEKAFPCDQCERSFPTKERLNSHYTLHTGNKPYVCEICNKSFAYKSSYGLHIRKQHGEQPLKSQSFKCDKCYQEFDIFVDFKRHLRSHEGEKPFTCHVCDKAFASKSILNVHSRIHNGTKPYKCEICGQAFTQKQSLDYHMRRHNEENPFKCEFCGMSFQRRYFLEKHKENQHGVTAPSSGRHDDSLGDLVGHEDLETSQTGDDDDYDDDGDSDPLKLEIDETAVKHDGNEDSLPIQPEIEMVQ